jgi:hypothetical protein
MTGHRQPWYLDRLRAELERVAAIEDRRERGPALGRLRPAVARLRPSPRLLVAVIAGALLVAIVVIAGAALDTRDDERSATPAPPAVPTASPATDEGAILRRLDGLYVANITAASLRRMQIPYDPPAGWWRIVVRSAERTITVSAPEGPESGDYVLEITGVEPGRLTFAPSRTCPLPEQPAGASTVGFTLSRSILTLRNAEGGCQPDWTLLTSTPWRKA